MAELLVYARGALSGVPDPVPGQWLPGEVVVVMPDGHVWGEGEDPAHFELGMRPFVVVGLPGVAVATARRYLDSHYSAYDPISGRPTSDATLLHRRRWRFEFGAVQTDRPDVAQLLMATGRARVRGASTPAETVCDMTWAEARVFLRDRIGDVAETRDL